MIWLGSLAFDANVQKQMKREQLAQEQAEKEKAEKAMKLKESFGDATGQWEKDKLEMQNIAVQDKKKNTAASVVDKVPAQAAAGRVEEKVAARHEELEVGKT